MSSMSREGVRTLYEDMNPKRQLILGIRSSCHNHNADHFQKYECKLRPMVTTFILRSHMLLYCTVELVVYSGGYQPRLGL